LDGVAGNLEVLKRRVDSGELVPNAIIGGGKIARENDRSVLGGTVVCAIDTGLIELRDIVGANVRSP
jgi:hypothetical protein